MIRRITQVAIGVLSLTAQICLQAQTAGGTPHANHAKPSAPDWSRAVVEQAMKRDHNSTELAQKSFRVAVSNPSNAARIEDVVLKVAEIERLFPDFAATAVTVTIDSGKPPSKSGSAANPVVVPSQADDLDGDGKADELVFQLSLQPKQTRVAIITYGPGQDVGAGDYTRRTDAKFAKHYDGMGWESESTAWRLYFDKRNAIDLWGKRRRGLYLETFAAPDYRYQEESPLGRDIYDVGKSLGAGGIGAWIDGRALPVSDVGDRQWRIVSRGPVRSIVEFTYKGWKVGDQTVDLTSRITQWAGERGYSHHVNLQGSESFPLVVGLSRKPGLEEMPGDSSCSLAAWGHQVVRPGTGATESLPDQNLGLAVLAPDAPKDCLISGDPMNFVIRPRLKGGSASWYVLAAWDQEQDRPVKSGKAFAALVASEDLRLSQPASVAVLDPPRANVANDVPPESHSDPPAAETVKILSGAEVRAAFEKGSPILTKDSHNYWVLAGRRDKPGQAELHEKDLDIFYVLQGTATFITGGKMVEGKITAPGEIRGTAIEGGEAHTLSKDDVIVIPAGIPHWFKEVQGLFLYYVVKVQQP